MQIKKLPVSKQQFFEDARIYEIGALYVNGKLFAAGNYEQLIKAVNDSGDRSKEVVVLRLSDFE